MGPWPQRLDQRQVAWRPADAIQEGELLGLAQAHPPHRWRLNRNENPHVTYLLALKNQVDCNPKVTLP